MPGKYEAPRRRRKRRNNRPLILGLALAAVLLAGMVGAVVMKEEKEPPVAHQTLQAQPVPDPVPTTTAPPETTLPLSEQLVSAASVSAIGDLLMHKPIFASGTVVNQGEGNYDYSSIFRYLSPYTKASDHAVANLETTFGGDGFPYQGNPTFNTHDSLMDAVKDAGFDMLLTANNHSYDTLMTGINRTLETVRDAGLLTLGTRLSEEEKRYDIVEVNGIRLGMVCYTYTMSVDGAGRPCLNNASAFEKPGQINYFSVNNLNRFYNQMEEILTGLEGEGVDATILYIHWGTEYELVENNTQRTMAQKLCDMGIDVIIGGHPHVVQPMDLLQSTVDPEKQTVCIYSLGNAVSNQRRDLMRLKTGHTEDGVMFTVNFEKYGDGTVKVGAVEVLPTWVNLHNQNGGQEYNILPLDKATEDQWQSLYGLTDAQLTEAKNSYNRTMTILEPGLNKVLGNG